jgi:hypothetical protein
VKRRALLRGACLGPPLLATAAGGACAPSAVPLLTTDDLPRDSSATFHAFAPGTPPEPVSGPDARWASGADDPARVESTPEGLLIRSLPGRRAWAAPRLPFAPLDAVPEGHLEEVTWESTVMVEQRFFVVCELRFAGEPGAVLVQATPFDLQVHHDPERPPTPDAAGATSRGRSESISRLTGKGQTHFWRLRLAGGRLDLRLDGSPIWTLDGPRALARLAFGETRTDDEHGGEMRLRDLVYVRRPANA